MVNRLLRASILLGFFMLAAPVAVNAATSPAQIVNCSTATACYSPNPISVPVGTTITWSNGTSLPHTATADSGSWDSGTIASGGTSSGITFNTAGTFAYHCRFHADMHGTVIVTAAATATPAATVRATTTSPTRGLAQSGGGSRLLIVPVLGGIAVILGLGIVTTGRLRRPRRADGGRRT